MSYGQYHELTTDMIARRGQKRDSGYPVPREDVKVGRMKTVEIMAGVSESEVVEIKKTAHNEVTRKLSDGTIICRLRETDIVMLHPNGCITVNTGGWNTITTRRHVMDFLSRHDFPVDMYGDKKGGGNILRHRDKGEIRFQRMVTFGREFALRSYWAD